MFSLETRGSIRQLLWLLTALACHMWIVGIPPSWVRCCVQCYYKADVLLIVTVSVHEVRWWWGKCRDIFQWTGGMTAYYWHFIPLDPLLSWLGLLGSWRFQCMSSNYAKNWQCCKFCNLFEILPDNSIVYIVLLNSNRSFVHFIVY